MTSTTSALETLRQKRAYQRDRCERELVLGNYDHPEFSRIDLLRDKLEQINRAIRRAEKGKYGTCEDCGARISRARLAAVTEATRCIGCARVIASRNRRFAGRKRSRRA